jgi:hypothetical protein
VNLQDEAWAVLYSLTNTMQKLNQEMAGTREYISLLPTYTPLVCFSQIVYNANILVSTLHDLHKTKPLVPKHTR